MSELSAYESIVAQQGEFQAWPKTPRLNREIVITEKIDGTNACIVVPDYGDYVEVEAYAQSRKKVILPSSDNFGFARWVFENRSILAEKLGPGRHFGEWYGSGIQSKYGLTDGERRFMLFNAGRWTTETVAECGLADIGVESPTVLYQGPFDQEAIRACVGMLVEQGSVHRPYDGKAEGIIVYHTAAGQVFKVMCEADEIPKGLV